MGLDTTSASAVLQLDYEPVVRDLLNNATLLLTQVRKNTRPTKEGEKIVIALHTGRNVGAGSRILDATLPTAGSQQYDRAYFTAKYHYLRINLSGPHIARASKDSKAFIDYLQSEMKGGMRDLKQLLNRQLWHDGTSVLTRCKTTTASVNLEVESTKFLKKNLKILIVNPSNGTVKETVTVSSITDADTAVVSAAVTTDTDDVVIEGEATSNASRDVTNATTWKEPVEMWGLEAAISSFNPGRDRGSTDVADVGPRGLDAALASGRFGEINRVGSVDFEANDIHNSGTLRDLTTTLMQEAWDQSDIEQDEKIGVIMTSHAVKRKYGTLLVPDKRYPAGGEITLDGGYKGLDFNGAAVVADKDASLTATPQKLNRMYFLTMSTLTFEVLEDWQWMQRDGSVLSRVSGKDAYEATLFAYMQLACDRCNANTLLDDLNE